MSSNADIVVSIMQAYRNPWFNMLKKINGTEVFDSREKHTIFNRQEAPEVFDLTTAFYVSVQII